MSLDIEVVNEIAAEMSPVYSDACIYSRMFKFAMQTRCSKCV